MDYLRDVQSFLEDVKNNAAKLSKQDKALSTIKAIEQLGETVANEKAGKSKAELDNESLEKLVGIEWSNLVFEEIEWRL